jgi:hypothetical protein
MAMTLRLSDSQTDALREAATRENKSMQEIVHIALDAYLSRRSERLTSAIARIKTEDQELLKRLSQ